MPLPTAIFVHEYLTVDGAKICKSAGNTVDPVRLRRAIRHRRGALVAAARGRRASATPTSPRNGCYSRYNRDLANGLGNLVNRTLTLVHRHRHGAIIDRTPTVDTGGELIHLCAGLSASVDQSLSAFDFRAATGAIWAVVAAANRLVEAERPWELARHEQAGDGVAGDRLDAVLTTLVSACRSLTHELTPFLPQGSAKLAAQLRHGRLVATPLPVFPRLE